MRPLCTFAIPSRKRFNRLLKSVDSIVRSCTDSSRINFRIRLDLDDHESLNRVPELGRLHDQIVVLAMPPKPWHVDRNSLWNSLLPHCSGIWHNFWSDDMLLLGKGWDNQLALMATDGVVVHPKIYKLGELTEYHNTSGGPVPFIPATALSHFQDNLLWEPPDTFIWSVLVKKLGWEEVWMEGITVEHERIKDEILPVL